MKRVAEIVNVDEVYEFIKSLIPFDDEKTRLYFHHYSVLGGLMYSLKYDKIPVNIFTSYREEKRIKTITLTSVRSSLKTIIRVGWDIEGGSFEEKYFLVNDFLES